MDPNFSHFSGPPPPLLWTTVSFSLTSCLSSRPSLLLSTSCPARQHLVNQVNHLHLSVSHSVFSFRSRAIPQSATSFASNMQLSMLGNTNSAVYRRVFACGQYKHSENLLTNGQSEHSQQLVRCTVPSIDTDRITKENKMGSRVPLLPHIPNGCWRIQFGRLESGNATDNVFLVPGGDDDGWEC